MNFEELKSFLMQAEYSDKQFREIKAIAEIRLGNLSSREASLKELGEVGPTYTQAFYNQLQQYLENHCKIAAPPLSVVKKQSPKTYGNVVQCANQLYAVAEDWNTVKTMRRNFVTGVYYLYSKLIVDYLRTVKVPVSVKTAVQHSDKFIGLVDNAYPGYVSGGMIDMVILGPSKSGTFGIDA